MDKDRPGYILAGTPTPLDEIIRVAMDKDRPGYILDDFALSSLRMPSAMKNATYCPLTQDFE